MDTPVLWMAPTLSGPALHRVCTDVIAGQTHNGQCLCITFHRVTPNLCTAVHGVFH